MSTIVLLSEHYYFSKKKAGFHFLARELSRLGHQVVFITTPMSFLSLVKNRSLTKEDGFVYNIFSPLYRDHVISIINFNILHPIERNSKFLEYFFLVFYTLNCRSKKQIKRADIIIFESCNALLFYKRIDRINRNANKIYRMSDDIEMLRSPSILRKAQEAVIDRFDSISVPTSYLYSKYKNKNDKVYLDYHGVDSEAFDNCVVNPYKIYGSKINHVFVGISNLDYRFLQIASKCFPDHLFHVIGPHRDVIKGQNIIYHGYLKYEETIGFIKFANVGLQIRSNENSIAYSLSDSLKVLQYSYCKLPVICPAVMKEYSHRRNLFYYEYDNPSSIADCIDQAVKFDRASFSNSDILNWNQVARKLIARTK